MPHKSGHTTTPSIDSRTGKTHWYHHVDVNHGQKSFADALNFYKLVWIFFVGCVIGTFLESVIVGLAEDKWWLHTAMVVGPFNQIYGGGALLMSICLYPVRNKSSLLIFVGSGIVGMAFEYVASWVQQYVFKSQSWQYSEMPFNIGGRTNLLFGLGWGVLGLIFIRHVWPFLSEYIERIPNRIGRPLTIAIAVFLALDLALSALVLMRWYQREQGIAAANAFFGWIDVAFPDSKLQRLYPTLSFV